MKALFFFCLLVSWALYYYYPFPFRSDRKVAMIRYLAADIKVRQYVQDYMETHHLRPSEVIDSYKLAMSKRTPGDPRTIYAETDDFVIYIIPAEQLIFSIGPNPRSGFPLRDPQ